ncbi:MAG: OsmC family protein [Nitrososphaera sp.]|nr:OsmC family protein [Nitrososphaera sp.]
MDSESSLSMSSQIPVNGVNKEVLGAVMESIKNNPDTARITFSVKTEWDGDGFKITSTGKDFRIGGQQIQRTNGFTLKHDFPEQMGGRSEGPTVCESCMASLSTCIAQTIVTYATMMGVQLDGIRIDTEGDVDIRGFTGLSQDVRPGAQEFRVKVHLESKSATREQLDKLYELGKMFSPAMDTLTHGTSVKTSLV